MKKQFSFRTELNKTIVVVAFIIALLSAFTFVDGFFESSTNAKLACIILFVVSVIVLRKMKKNGAMAKIENSESDEEALGSENPYYKE